VYGDSVVLSGPGYYSKFIFWTIARSDDTTPIFHLTRSESEYGDVGSATAASFPSVPDDYTETAIPLIGVVYKKNKDWSDLSGTADWIVTSFLSIGSVTVGSGGGIDIETVAELVEDSLAALRIKAEIDSILTDSIATRALIVAGNATIDGVTYTDSTAIPGHVLKLAADSSTYWATDETAGVLATRVDTLEAQVILEVNNIEVDDSTELKINKHTVVDGMLTADSVFAGATNLATAITNLETGLVLVQQILLQLLQT